MNYKIPFVNFGAQYLQHRDEYDWAIKNCLLNGKLILQEQLEEFEENLAKRLGMRYAVGVGNGTDALILALKSKGYSDDKILTSPYTFKATHEAIRHNGFSVVFRDIDSNRLAEDVHIPVHIEGMVAHSDKAILEDAAQAIGAEGVGYSGTFTLSFYPAKILGGFGDGGAVVTNDIDVANKVRLYRHHWQTNVKEEVAYNSRLDNVQAAFLNVKLKYLDEILARRKEIAEKYLKAFKKLPIGLPYNQPGRVWQDFVLQVSQPERLAGFLKERGIQTLGYGMTPPPVAWGLDKSCSNTEKLYAEMIRLPLNETLTNENIEEIISAVKEFYATK